MARKAFLVGINTYPTAPLKGCVNDCNNLKNMLLTKFNFREEDVVEIYNSRATREFVLDSWSDFIDNLASGDQVWVHFSCHGTYITDNGIDEADGYDESLVMWFDRGDDFYKALILDDEIAIKVKAMNDKGAQVIITLDACHSGTGTRELKYQAMYNVHSARFIQAPFRPRKLVFPFLRWLMKIFSKPAPQGPVNPVTQQPVEDQNLPEHVHDDSSGNLTITACLDNETASDAFIDGGYNGAFTYYMVGAFKKNLTPLFASEEILEGCRGYDQTPQMYGGRFVLINSLFFKQH